LSKGINVGNLTSLQVGSTDRAGRAETIILKGTAGLTTIKSSQFRTFMGSNRIKSTFFTIGGETPPMPLQSTGVSQTGVPRGEPGPLTPMDEQLLIAFTKKGVFNTEELMDMLIRPENRSIHLRRAMERQSGNNTSLSSAAKIPVSFPAGKAITFSGRGWGHGVGMSQWGAKRLSESGWDHLRILQHYFPGTAIAKVSY
ncbi:MAG: hypothetical protein RQ767_07095, partial [Thermovirgaceae bacterium]|nr:hypothetical protein [Thermovirgaceae bacterium]